jgi:Mn2+/Fe2+ NRAMP family transporter
MFFWQASEEVEDEAAHHMLVRGGQPVMTPRFMASLRLDNVLGMVASEIATWSIIVVGGTVLHAHGVTTIVTAADAARALEPLVQSFPHAGTLARLLFAVGILGLGFLAVPVLSGAAAYAFAETFGWHQGLARKLRDAHGFYGVITIATVIGLAINFIGIDPMQALIYTAVINGVVAVPLLFLIARLAERTDIMGEYRSGWLSRSLVWLTFLAMGAAAVAMLVALLRD